MECQVESTFKCRIILDTTGYEGWGGWRSGWGGWQAGPDLYMETASSPQYSLKTP